MQYESLYNLAEMAITMIGIAGLVTVFLSKGDLHPFDKFRFIAIVLIGFSVAILAYTPIWINGTNEPHVNSWRIGASIAIGLQLTFLSTSAWLGRSMIREGLLAPKSFGFLLTIVALSIFAGNSINALSWPFQSNRILYELCLFLLLLMVALQFVSLVIFRPPTSDVTK
jgi:hypothetical protein